MTQPILSERTESLTSTKKHQHAAQSRPRSSAEGILWLDAHGDVLFAYAMQRTRDVHVAEDLVQDTLVAALESHERFESRSSVRTWLVGILKHKLADHRRRNSRRVDSSDPSNEEDPTLEVWLDQQFTKRGKWVKAPARWPKPERLSQAELDELRTVLDACLQKMSQRARVALELVEASGKTAKETCNVLNVSTTHIGVLLFRARTALRKCLETRWFDRRTR